MRARGTSAAAAVWAWDQPVKAPLKVILLALAEHVGAGGEASCYPGQKRIAELCGLSERAVRDHLVTLEQGGYIKREERRTGGKRTSDHITLLIPLPAESVGLPAESVEKLPASSAGEVEVQGQRLNTSTAEAVDEMSNVDRIDSTEAETIRRVFAYWQKRCGHPQSKLDPKRRTAIRGRLREGRTADEFKRAIDGAALRPYIDTATGKTYDDIELVCRNAVKFEDFMDRAAPQQTNNGGGKYGRLSVSC